MKSNTQLLFTSISTIAAQAKQISIDSARKKKEKKGKEMKLKGKLKR